MNLSTPPDRMLRTRRQPHRVDDHVGDETRQIESIVEGAEIKLGVLAELEGFVRSLDQGLQVAQHRVHPAEIRHIPGLALADNDVGVGAACIDHGREARQPIAQHVRTRLQAGQSPVLDRFLREAADRRHLHVQRVAVGVQRYGGHEGHLVRRAAADYARPLAAEIGIVRLDVTFEPVLLMGAGHHAADLLLNQPSRSIADAKVAHERQRGQPGLGLAHEVEGEKPGAQRKLRAFQHRAGGERRLVAAGGALQQRPVRRRSRDPVALRLATLRASVARRPANLLQGSCALVFATVPLDKLAHRHPGLELDFVDRHRVDSMGQWSQITGSVAHQMSLLSFMPNQVHV